MVTFLWPAMLLLLAALPVGVVGYLAIARRRRRQAALHGIPIAGSDGGVGRRSRIRRQVVGAYTITGLAILLLALARPEGVVSLPRVEGTIILAFDVSGSMAATDAPSDGRAAGQSGAATGQLGAPSGRPGAGLAAADRMEAAKALARSIVDQQPAAIRIGVVAFSDSAFSTQVPTAERSDVLAAIERLSPERGTSLGRGILTSIDVIETALGRGPQPDFYSNRSPAPTSSPTPVAEGTYVPAIIVMFTDGENNQAPDPLEAARVAADRGIRIHSVGVGTVAGTTLEVEGFIVHSALDESLLRAVGELTDGSYVPADDPGGLDRIDDEVGSALVVRPETIELTSLVAGLGLAVVLVGGIASLLWFGRYP
jgi:Ca-activated chloride channel family protein